MPFLFNPCSASCCGFNCDGYVEMKIGCEPSPPTNSGFPSYLNVNSGDVAFVVYDSGGNVLSTCYPLVNSGICEFKVKGGTTDTVSLIFATGLNTPTMTGWLPCYPDGTGAFNVNKINNLNAAFPCWVPSSGVTLTFHWNYEYNLYTREAGIYSHPTGVFSNLCQCLGPQSPNSNVYVQTQIFATNPFTVFIPFGNNQCYSTGVLLATIQSTEITPSGSFVCNLTTGCGASTGPYDTINSGTYCTHYSSTDYYAYFSCSASCAQTQVGYYIHQIDHGQPKLYPDCTHPLSQSDFIETYTFASSGVTSCSPLLMTAYGALRSTNICKIDGTSITISGVNQATISQ